MTSQIAIFNHTGVAIASDTVTTIGNKTLGNSSKIFLLPEPHAVAVLHNGAVFVNSVNSRLLLTEWARQLNSVYPSVEDYYKSFVEWFNSPRAIHTRASENDLLISAIEDYLSWLAEATDKAVYQIEYDSDRTIEQYEELRKATCSEEIERLIKISSQWPNYVDLSDVTAAELIGNAKQLNVSELVKTYFDRMNLPKSVLVKIQKSVIHGVSRVSMMKSDSEFIFTGFGSNEAFAREFKLVVRGAYGGRLKYTFDTDGVKADHPRAKMVPLAQTDAIDSFNRGWNPRIRDAVVEAVWDKAWDAIYELKASADSLAEGPDEVTPIANKIRDEVREAVDEFSLHNFVYPLMDTVDAMSLTTMAELAESLIGIQAASTFGKKGAATVGGFVEVITIDRQNGVRWRKRLPDTTY